MKKSSAITVSNLRKTFYGRGEPVRALCGVDLAIPQGEIFGFLGPNGAGKTTTLRILTTLLPFEEGEVIVAGRDVRTDPNGVRESIGYVSQKGGTDPSATGWENLILQGQLYGLTKPEALDQATDLVNAFALEEAIHRFVRTYSGGQKRRLDIALAMMHRPQILFLDEPTNGLDPQSRENLWLKILELKKQGITIFLTSHYLDEVDALADTLAIMDHGAIVASGTPHNLKKEISGDIITLGMPSDRHPSALSLFEGNKELLREIRTSDHEIRLYVDKGSSAMPAILRLLDHAKIPFETIHLSVPSLNDVFLKKTGRLLREEAIQ